VEDNRHHTREDEMATGRNEREQAFEEQALVHTDELHRCGLRLTGNAADADDLVQETYLRAYRFWEKYEQGTNVRAWLFRIMRNCFINSYRKQSKAPTMKMYDETVPQVLADHDTEDTHTLKGLELHHHFDDEVAVAILDLAEEFRAVVVMSDIDGMTYQEIAGLVECPLGTVRSRLHRGRRLLQAKLSSYAQTHGYVSPDGLAGNGFGRSSA
jgi:RNA polymerase sigma-70 factor, ECF subfamily